MSCRTSIGRPLEFCKFASNVLEFLISSRNAIKISTGRPVELFYRTSPRAEDLALCFFKHKKVYEKGLGGAACQFGVY